MLDPAVRKDLIVACMSEPEIEVTYAVLQAKPPRAKSLIPDWEHDTATWLKAQGFEYVRADFTRKVLVIRMGADARIAMYIRSRIK